MVMPRKHARWTVQDDFVLMMLVGKQSFKQIALRLGRSPSAVQRRSSAKKYSDRSERREQREARRDQIEEILIRNLNASEEELAEYLDIDNHQADGSVTP